MKTIIRRYTPPTQTKNKGLIWGYGSYFDKVDHQRDIIVKGAFSKTLKAWQLSGKQPKILWQHQADKPIGLWDTLVENEQGLYVSGHLALGTRYADEAYHLLKEQIIDGLSIGFRTLKAVQDPQRKARLILDLDLIEISLVTFGANPKATIDGVKFGYPYSISRGEKYF